MLLIKKEDMAGMIALIKKGDQLDPKEYAWILYYLEREPEVRAARNAFELQVEQLFQKFRCPRSIIIKCLLEGLTEDQMLLEIMDRSEENSHVVLIFSKDRASAQEQAEILTDFLSSVEDVEVLTFIVKPTERKEDSS